MKHSRIGDYFTYKGISGSDWTYGDSYSLERKSALYCEMSTDGTGYSIVRYNSTDWVMGKSKVQVGDSYEYTRNSGVYWTKGNVYKITRVIDDNSFTIGSDSTDVPITLISLNYSLKRVDPNSPIVKKTKYKYMGISTVVWTRNSSYEAKEVTKRIFSMKTNSDNRVAVDLMDNTDWATEAGTTPIIVKAKEDKEEEEKVKSGDMYIYVGESNGDWTNGRTYKIAEFGAVRFCMVDMETNNEGISKKTEMRLELWEKTRDLWEMEVDPNIDFESLSESFSYGFKWPK